ncbi:MAG: M56 family metallopeptidase [Verrucomicrobiota bacterium]
MKPKSGRAMGDDVNLTEWMNQAGDQWVAWIVNGLLEGSLALGLVLALWLGLRRFVPAQFGYCLFFLVPAALFIPFHYKLPLLPPVDRPTTMARVQAAFTPLPENRTLAVKEKTGAESVVAAPIRTGEYQLSLSARLMIAWALVVLAGLAHLLWISVRTRRMASRSVPVGPDFPINFDFLKAARRVPETTRLCLSDDLSSPAVCCAMAPRILFPRRLADSLTESEMEWALAHELAHLRRGDLWALLAQRLVLILFFFHPAVWIAHWFINELREHACDDEASAESGATRREAAHSFVTILENANGRLAAPFSMAGFTTQKGPIQRRIMRLLRPSPGTYRLTPGLKWVLLPIGALVLPGFALEHREVTHHLNPLSPEKGLLPVVSLSSERPSASHRGRLITPPSHRIQLVDEATGESKEARVGAQNYQITRLDTRSLIGPACLEVAITMGDEGIDGSFDLFPGDLVLPEDFDEQEQFRSRFSRAFVYRLYPRETRSLHCFLKNGELLQLGATGGWGNPEGARSSYRFEARVREDYAEIQRTRFALTTASPRRTITGHVARSGYVVYEIDVRGLRRPGAIRMVLETGGEADGLMADLFAGDLRIPADPRYHETVQSSRLNYILPFALKAGKKIRSNGPSLTHRFPLGGLFQIGVSGPWIADPHPPTSFTLSFSLHPQDLAQPASNSNQEYQ